MFKIGALILIILFQISLVAIKQRFLMKLSINIISISLKILLLVRIFWFVFSESTNLFRSNKQFYKI